MSVIRLCFVVVTAVTYEANPLQIEDIEVVSPQASEGRH